MDQLETVMSPVNDGHKNFHTVKTWLYQVDLYLGLLVLALNDSDLEDSVNI